MTRVSDLVARFHASEQEPDTERRKAIACQVYADAVRMGLMTEYLAAVLGYTRSDTHGAQDGMRRTGGHPRKHYPSDIRASTKSV